MVKKMKTLLEKVDEYLNEKDLSKAYKRVFNYVPPEYEDDKLFLDCLNAKSEEDLNKKIDKLQKARGNKAVGALLHTLLRMKK